MKGKNELRYDVIVTGAGPAGLMAAITAAGNGARVLVLEKNDKPLKKLYATGNGRCNFSNYHMDDTVYRGGSGDYVQNVLKTFDREKLLTFFENLGMMTKDIDGYIYPYNEQARTVASALLLEAQRLGVEILCEEQVADIEKPKQPGGEFAVNTADKNFRASSLIIAVGGKASPAHGSDGNLNDLIKALGHKIKKQKPALVPLTFEDKRLSKLQGVREKCLAYLSADGHVLTKERGEIIFNKDNISGIPIMQMSRFATCIDDRKKHITAELDLFPDESDETLEKRIKTMFCHAGRTAVDALSLCLNEKMAAECLTRAGIPLDKPSSDISEAKLKELRDVLKKFKVDITGNAGFERAQVTAGGVPLDELAENLESRLVPGLFIVGELCDVDGTCGGYNLQWAFSSGAVAGMSCFAKKHG